MSQTDDLREALACDLRTVGAAIERSRTALGVNICLVSSLGKLTLRNLPLILDALAQVSALQAEVERLQTELKEAHTDRDRINAKLGEVNAAVAQHLAPVEAIQAECLSAIAAANAERDAVSERLQKVEGERDAAAAALSDPVRVHASMLAGAVAKPSIANVVHLYGAEALRAALGPRAREEPLVCPRCGIGRSYLPACMQSGCPTLLDQAPSDNPLTETKEGSEHV